MKLNRGNNWREGEIRRKQLRDVFKYEYKFRIGGVRRKMVGDILILV